MISINPVNNKIIKEYPEHSQEEVREIIEKVSQAWLEWKGTTFDHRSGLFRNAARVLRDHREEYARLMTSEMGKIIRESLAEVEKCANACEFFADHSERLLKDEVIETDARRSIVTFPPLGVILAVMPWNFPFWQVFRFAAPSLMAGNAAVLKHASNVPGCAKAIEGVFRLAGFPDDLFRTLMIPSRMVEEVIRSRYIAATTLTGSEPAGSRVASLSGSLIKKSVLELGGSDAFLVLEDADMQKTVRTAVTARMINQGQSCIAAKRFIVAGSRREEFEEKLKKAFEQLKTGDPLDPETDVGPMARKDLVDDIESQVRRSLAMGARLVTGGRRPDLPGFYYLPTILAGVTREMPVFAEETFGPVAAIIPFGSEQEAIEIANDYRFGLGGSIWTEDLKRGEEVARRIETGAMFVNGLTKSDPRLPFGGIRKSGYGRELSEYGIKEFVNIKTIWIG